MIAFHIAALFASLTFTGAFLALCLWGVLRLCRIVRRRLTPMCWIGFGVLATVNALADLAVGFYAAVLFDAVCFVWALVMYRKRTKITDKVIAQIG